MTTRLQLRTATRVAADQDNSTFPTDTALNDIIDRATKTVWRRMIAVGWKPDRTTVTITANGAASYPIGTDVSVVHSVAFIGPGSTRTLLRRVKPEQLQSLLTPQLSPPAQAYDLIGGGNTAMTVELYPVPTSGTYEVRYTRRFPGFSGDTDTWFGPDGSDDLIIYTSAVDSVMKEGDPADMVSTLNQRLSTRWTEVIEAAGWTDSMGQQTIRDTRQTTRFPFDFDVQGDREYYF